MLNALLLFITSRALNQPAVAALSTMYNVRGRGRPSPSPQLRVVVVCPSPGLRGVVLPPLPP